MKYGKTASQILFFLGLSLPLLALITIGWLVRETSGRFQQSFFQVEHTYKVVNLVEQTNMTELQNLIDVRLGIDPDKIKSGNLPDMLAVSLTDEGKKTMDEVNRVLFQMREQEEVQLNEREQRTQDDAISGQIATVILIGTVAVALIFIIFILF